MISKRLAFVIVFFTLVFVCAASQAFSASYWSYDGQAYSKVIWSVDGTSTQDQQFYGPLTGSVDAVVSFADGHAQSGDTSASVNSIAVGLIGYHSTISSGTAAATIYGLAEGAYTISFDYVTTPNKVEGLLFSTAYAGYEMSGSSNELSGSDHFSTIVNPDEWVSFFTRCQTNALDGSITASASIFNITVEPYSAIPTPIPGAAWLLGSGLIGLAGFSRRKK